MHTNILRPQKCTYFELEHVLNKQVSSTDLAGIHPSLQVASTEHRIIQDIAINNRLHALFLVDQQYIGRQQMVRTIFNCRDKEDKNVYLFFKVYRDLLTGDLYRGTAARGQAYLKRLQKLILKNRNYGVVKRTYLHISSPEHYMLQLCQWELNRKAT